MSTEVDIVIVGGGAAGIAAARRLAGSGVSTLLLEASSRLGGRAWTLEAGGYPLDLGCGWLHSADRNPWTKIADLRNFDIDRSEAAWGTQWSDLGFSPDELRAAKGAVAEWEKRLPALASVGDRAADAIAPDDEWSPYVRAFCGFANGVAPERMSASDYLAYDAACTYRNWRVPTGYGVLIASSLPEGARFRLSTPVTRIGENRRGVEVQTPYGAISARAVIVTVSTNVLSRGTIDLPPSLDAWREAASVLPLGFDEKLFLRLDGDTPFMAETHLFGDLRDSRSCSFYLRPLGRPIIECFLGGDSAKVVLHEGLTAGFDLAIDQLVKLMGSAVRPKLKPLVGSSWAATDRIGGAYSCALPGQAAARQRLATSWEQKIFFAGEATNRQDFATAHGAHDSGVRAAEEALSALPTKAVPQPTSSESWAIA